MTGGAVDRRTVLALFVLSLFLVSPGLAPPSVSGATSTTTTSSAATPGVSAAPTSLLLTVIPPKLPADGGTYPAVVVSLQSSAGKASMAVNDTTVFLTSSQANVGSVSAQVTIKAGTGFAVANFTATSTPGTCVVSASSVGLSATSSALTTVTPSGIPTHLKVIAVPGTLLVNPLGHGTVLVETLDAVGLPAKVISGSTVALSSSDNSVVSLPLTSILIPAGAALASATYETSARPGTATITASSSGFNSGASVVTVVGPSPFALKISAEPDPVATGASGRLVVTLTDPSGNPARAPAPITVTINSSNNSVVASDQTATIQSGQVYAVASFTSGHAPGSANLTASSPGLKSDFAAVAVSRPSQPVKLKLLVSPDPVLADKGDYASIVVALTDAGGVPAVASSGISVTLTSANSQVGSVESSVVIGAGSSYAVATFSSTFFVGSTPITASAQNLLSASATVDSYGPIPSKVVVQASPGTLAADGGTYSALAVILEDSSGSPAVAPVGVEVQLASSRTDIAYVNSTIVIGEGQTYALTNVTTTISPGTANFTASSSGLDSSSTGVATITPAPSQLAVFVAPASAIQPAGSGGTSVIAVQLQDSNSLPALARQDTSVVVTSSNSSVMPKPLRLSIGEGTDYAYAVLRSSNPGASVVTASTSGLTSASASLAVLPLPIAVSIVPSAPVVTVGTPATLTVQVEFLGSPLPGANVTFAASSGVVTPAEGVTNSMGQFSSTFVPGQNGVSVITATVYSPYLVNQTASTNVLATLAGSGGAGGGGLGAVGPFLPVVAVVVVIAALAVGVRTLLKRRRKGSDGGDASEE